MPGQSDLPMGEDNNNSSKPRWLTKEQAMEKMKVGKTKFYDCINKYGLKVSRVGSIMRILDTDIDEFWMGHRR